MGLKNLLEFLKRLTGIGLTALLCIACCGAAFAEVAPGGENAAAPAVDGAFTFREGITWSTTPAQMMEAEHVNDLSPTQIGAFEAYTLENITASRFQAKLGFIFKGSQLVLAGYSFTPYSLVSEDFQYLFRALNAKYGNPTFFDAQHFMTLIGMLDSEADFSEADLASLYGWTLSDGTLIVLFNVGTLQTDLLYLNEPQLLKNGYSPYNTEGL